MKGLKNWFEIFKAGSYTSSKGIKRNWSTEDLDRIVEATNFSVPLVVGHVKVNYPVYGKADKLKRVGQKLYAKCNEVKAEFEQFVKDSSKGLSVSINSDYSLNHIAFLAVEQPAVSDLAPIEFSKYGQNEAETYDYNEFKFYEIADIFETPRDFFIEKFGIDSANQVISKWQLNNLKRSDESQDDIYSFCEQLEDLSLKGILSSDYSKQLSEKDAKIKELESKLVDKETAKEKDEYSKQLNEKESRIKELEAELAKESLIKQKAEFSSYCDDLAYKCRLTPAQKTVAFEVFNKSTDPKTYDFSEGKNEVAESVKKLLDTLPVQFSKGEMDFSDVAKQNQDADIKKGLDIANSLK